MAVLFVKTTHVEDGKNKNQIHIVEIEEGPEVEEKKKKYLEFLNNWLDAVFSTGIPSQLDRASCTFEILDLD